MKASLYCHPKNLLLFLFKLTNMHLKEPFESFKNEHGIFADENGYNNCKYYLLFFCYLCFSLSTKPVRPVIGTIVEHLFPY